MSRVVLVDSGGSNLGSVQAALHRLGIDAPLTHDYARIRAASHVLLPGVGAAAAAMARLAQHGLVERLPTLTQPVLGICVGMQILCAGSDEGDVACLGILPGRVRRLPASPGVRIPHMGWNRLASCRSDPLTEGLDGAHAYFVHSYAVDEGAETLMRCRHGLSFAAVVRQGNFYGAQFHPERSGAVGARLLANFLALPGG